MHTVLSSFLNFFYHFTSNRTNKKKIFWQMIPSGSKIDFNLLVSLLDNKTFGLMKLVKHSVKTSTCSAWILKFAGSACWKIFTHLLITYKAKKEIQSGFLLFDYRFLKNYLFFLFWRSCESFFFSTFWWAFMRVLISSDVSFLWRE